MITSIAIALLVGFAWLTMLAVTHTLPQNQDHHDHQVVGTWLSAFSVTVAIFLLLEAR